MNDFSPPYIDAKLLTFFALGWATKVKPPSKGELGFSSWRKPSPSDKFAKISLKC